MHVDNEHAAAAKAREFLGPLVGFGDEGVALAVEGTHHLPGEGEMRWRWWWWFGCGGEAVEAAAAPRT